MEKTYTVEQIKTYIRSKDSLGDVLYFCNEENIDKANEEYNDSLKREEETGRYLPPFHETWND